MAINVSSGTWGLSLIIEEEPGVFTTSALLNRIASGGSECHYPPLNAAKTGYTFPYALVYCRGTVANDANTFFIPRNIDTTGTIGDLTIPQRNAVSNFLTSNFTGYSYTDWDGTIVNVPAFDFGSYVLSTPLVELIRALFAYLGNSDYRPRPAPFESHNTEYTDDFSTDPASRWTQELANSYTWDSGTNDLDSGTGVGDTGQRYSANGPGSIEHEAQVTHTGGTNRSLGPAVRFANDGTDDLYAVQAMSDTNLTLWRWNGATRTYLADPDTITTYTSGHWYTIRMAASGTSGSNVVLDVWCQEHGSSTKPSDPGWYGVDGTPGGTYTDTSVDRLDDGSLHLHCGIGGRDAGSTTTGDFFKLRAISDRAGTATLVGAQNILRGMNEGFQQIGGNAT